MKTTKNLKIIDGSYSFGDAKEILMNMFLSKINYHDIKNWSAHERFGKPMTLAVTFPINFTIGLPIYFLIVQST